MFWQVDQGRFAHLGRTLVLDALDLLQGLVDGSFVGQQGISDVELAFLFGGNGRHAVQRALITAVVGEAGARFQTGDVPLAQSVGVFPQGEDRQFLDIVTQTDAQITGCVMQHRECLAVFIT